MPPIYAYNSLIAPRHHFINRQSKGGLFYFFIFGLSPIRSFRRGCQEKKIEEDNFPRFRESISALRKNQRRKKDRERIETFFPGIAAPKREKTGSDNGRKRSALPLPPKKISFTLPSSSIHEKKPKEEEEEEDAWPPCRQRRDRRYGLQAHTRITHIARK